MTEQCKAVTNEFGVEIRCILDAGHDEPRSLGPVINLSTMTVSRPRDPIPGSPHRISYEWSAE